MNVIFNSPCHFSSFLGNDFHLAFSYTLRGNFSLDSLVFVVILKHRDMKPICRAKDLLEVGSKRTFTTSASQGFLFFGTPLALLVGFTKVNTWCKRRTCVLLEQPGWTRRFYFFSFFFLFFLSNLTFGSGVVDFCLFSLQVVTLELCLSGSQEIATIKLSSSSPMCRGP